MARKKIIYIVLTCLMIVGLTGCTGYNNSKDYHENGVRYAVDSSGGKHAMAMEYEWDMGMDPESLTINIPDEVCDGYEVTDLGGFTGIGVPALFEIECDYDRFSHHNENSECLAFKGTDPDLYDYPVSFEKLVFTVNLGKNVKKIRLQYDPNPEPVKITNDDGTVEYRNVEAQNQWIALEREDGSIIWYEAILHFNVSEENEYYYSRDGELKRKE